MSASPQLEDGYIKIVNELFDAVLRYPFTARQLKVVLAIMRKTYGFNKKIDDVSSSQIGEMSGMARTHATNTLNELARMNVIFKAKGKYGSLVELNKNYKVWASTESVHPLYQIGTCTESVQADGNSLILIDGCTESVQGYQIGTCTESVQVASTESVHTKDNLPKDIKPSRVTADTKFDEAWNLYPKREGGNSKAAALKAWNSRIKSGVTAEQMIAGVKRYAKQVRDAGNEGSKYVKMASTFFGPDQHFVDDAPLEVDWWSEAGFTKEWQAVNAGCTEVNAYQWRNGERIKEQAA
jgi:phage replication O-like protein O